MAEQQPAAQTPNPTTPTTPAPTPATTPPPEEPKFTGDVSGLLAQPPTIDEDVTDAEATPAEPEPAEESEEPAAGQAAGEEPSADPEPEPEATEPAPAPAAAEKPAADQQAAQAAQQEAAQRAQRKAQASRELSTARTALAALKAKGDIDPYEAAPLQTEIALLTAELTEVQLAEVDALRQHEAARQQLSAADQMWANWGANDEVGKIVGAEKGRKVYLEEEAKAFKRFGSATPEQRAAAVAAATIEWEHRIGLTKGHAEKKAAAAAVAAAAKPATPKPTTPVGKGKPGGATVLPAGASVARPAAKPPQTAEQVLASKVGPSIKNYLD